jgi:hypothetical protein
MAKIGLDAVLYLGTVGSGGVASYSTPMNNVLDLTLNLEHNEAEITCRGSEWDLFALTTKKCEISFEMIWDEDDADFEDILAAWVGKTVINMKCLSSSDGAGIDAEWQVFKLERSEPLKDVIKASVTIKPTYSTRYPSWVNAS